jgi:hypothetical protein
LSVRFEKITPTAIAIIASPMIKAVARKVSMAGRLTRNR